MPHEQEYQSHPGQTPVEAEWRAHEVAARRRLLGHMSTRGLMFIINRLPPEVTQGHEWAELLARLAREEILDREFGKPRDVAS